MGGKKGKKNVNTQVTKVDSPSPSPPALNGDNKGKTQRKVLEDVDDQPSHDHKG
jgi:hypothetical protein